MTSSIKMPSTKKAMNALSKKRPPSIELNPASSQEVACCLHPTAGIMMTKQQSASRTKHAANTNTLLLQTILNHASWSTLHVAARYLQVYAHPLVFDGQGVLSSAKGFAALFLFLLGIISSWVDRTCCCRSGDSSLPAAFAEGSESVTACDADKKDENKNNGVQTRSAGDYGSLSADKQLQQEIPSSKELNTSVSNPTENEVDAQNDELQSTEKSMQFRRKVFYTILFAFVSTCRASLNIASAKYTYPYNITLIASLTPVVIAIFDALLLHSPFPPLLWPTILLSGFGGMLVALSQSQIADNPSFSSESKMDLEIEPFSGIHLISPRDNAIGCSLQFLSAIFSAFARLLMKHTEHLLSPTHIVQTNNISNCVFPLIYTLIQNPASWMAFHYLLTTPSSLLAWTTISIGVYSFASTRQIKLVRALGPGFYSSWVAIRVLGSMVLSALVLGEEVNNSLEWVGIFIMITTVSIYLVETRKWMESRENIDVGKAKDESLGDGDEELVTIPQYGENRPLLGGPNATGSGAQGNVTAGNSGCKSYNSLDAPIPLAKEHQDSQSTAWNSIAKRLHPVFCFAFLFVCGSIVSIQRIQVNKLQQYRENPLQSAFRLTSLASNCPVQWQTYSTPKVREDIPSFPSYLSYNCQPIEVTYDKRSLRLNDQPVIFLSGSIHPARETATTWERALDQAVAGGMNMITMYVVWSAHQPSRNESMNWSFPESTQSSSPTAAVPTWDLSSAITSAGSRGLFVHLRIGPYICAEYDYGGIPEWVPANSKMNMRRPNAEWMKAMSTYVNETVKYITQNHLWSHQGGPIVIGQIENEIGGEVDPETEKLVPGTGKGEFAAMQDYADWSGRLAEEVAPNVTWTMCNGLTAPNCINTCNGYGEDGACSSRWLEHHGQNNRVQIDQPALWTEDESGFQIWGDTPSEPSDYFWGRTARDFARDGVRWFARGGSHLNYYMLSGGYNRGRSAAAGIRNAYASDALLCPSGEQRHPKYDHLKEFHRAIAEISEALINAPSALNTPQTVEVILNRTEEAPIWITGLQQRMFAYSGVNSSSDKDVLFIENDADTLERVRVTKNVDFVIEMQPHSAVIVVGGGEIILFDSASISIEAKQFERKTTVVNDNLDWKSWLEPIGESKHKFISKDGLKEQTSTLQQLAVSSDYLWYSTDLIIEHHFTNARMKIITEKAVAILVFIDEQFIGGADNHEHGEGWVELIVPCGGLTAGSHKLSILSESLGHYNLIGRWGAKTTAKSKGLYEVLLLDETGTHGINISSQTWQMSAGFLENNEPRNSMVSNTEGHDDLVAHSGTRPKWSVAYFTTPEYDILKQRLFVNIKSGRGHLYINGHDLGRFWNITRSHQQELYSQQYYYLPTDWLQVDKALNELKIFDVYGSDLSSVSIILSWVAFNNSISPGMIDEVDFVDACLI